MRPLLNSICPLFGKRPTGATELVGSAVLLAVHGHRFLITAAHCTDYVACGSFILPISGDQFSIDLSGPVTNSPGGERGRDRYDIACFELPLSAASRFKANFGFLPIDAVAVSDMPTSSAKYLLTGFPDSETEFRPQTDQFGTTLKTYFGRNISPKRYDAHHLNSQTHSGIDYDPSELGFIPKCMSGGGIWCHAPNSKYNDPIALAGIFLEASSSIPFEHQSKIYPSSVLIGVRITVALEMIRSTVPELHHLISESEKVKLRRAPVD